jgi:hypothetical protein
MGTIKRSLISLAAVFSIVLPLAAPAMVYADQTDSNVTSKVCQAANNPTNSGIIPTDLSSTNATCNINDQTNTFNNLLTKIINILSIIVGIVAVIMIIVGGFRYITSGGNSEKVAGAKNTILYGIIGLVIVALAQVIVRFVLNKTASTT